MKLNPKILFSLTLGILASSYAKAQYAQNKKASVSQVFTLRLTKPAGTQLDLAATANKIIGDSKTVTPTVPAEINSDQKNTSGLTVTGVTTESKDAQTTQGSVSFAQQPSNETVQIITLSKA